MPEYLISYCPELAAWRLTDCETWKQRAMFWDQVKDMPAELLAVFEAARSNPDKTQSINFRRMRETAAAS